MPAPGSASGLFYGCHSSSEFLRREAPEAAWAARLARLEAAVRRKARGRRQSPRMRRIMARTVQMHAQEMQQQQQLRRGDGSGQHGGGRMSTGGGGNGEGCGAKRMRTDGGGRGGDGGGEGGGSRSEAGEVSMPGKSRRVAGGPVRPGPPTHGPQGPQGPRTEQPLEKARCEQRGRERDGFHGRPGLGSGHPGHQPAARQRQLGAAMEADSSSKQRVRVRSKRKSRARSSSRVPEHCGAPSARRVQHTPPWASTNSTVTTATAAATSTDNNNNDDNRCSPLSGGDVSTAAVPGQVHLTTSTSSNDVSSQPRAGPLPGAERAGSRTHPGGACPRPAATAPPPHKLVAIDCEMVGLGPGGCRGALARCSVVDYHGSVLYDSYVRPEEPVTDYRTRWSGVRPAHMRDATPFRAAQTEIVRLLHNKVVVGHSIANDFRALSYVHPVERTRDTAALLELRRRAGLPMAQPASLKRLTKLLLYRDIQVGRHGHSSVEDARATMELYRLVEAQLGGSGGPA